MDSICLQTLKFKEDTLIDRKLSNSKDAIISNHFWTISLLSTLMNMITVSPVLDRSTSIQYSYLLNRLIVVSCSLRSYY